MKNFTSKSKNKSKNKSLRVILIVAFAVVLLSFFWTNREGFVNKKNQKAQSESSLIKMKYQKFKELKFSPQQLDKSNYLIVNVPENTIKAQQAMEFFRGMMADKAFSLFFNYTLNFFEDSPAAYPAARFVALTLLFDSSEESFYLRSWTQKEIINHSEEIMQVLEKKVDEIDVNPYFHSRMLNLAYQLNIAPERKLKFFTPTLSKPLQLDENGDLLDYSLSFETALILSKQSEIKSAVMGSIISQSIVANSRDPIKLQAFKIRVLTYFPDLTYLFDKAT